MTKKGSRKSPRSRTAARVRMYDVGFGDCFLLFIPGPDRLCKVLVDCGSIAKRKTPMADIVGQIIEDCAEGEERPTIDVVVATHRHRDHISGFADQRWSEVEVKEVWMPWTEGDEPEARRIRNAQTRLATSLLARLTRLGADEDLTNVVLNATPNEDAMETLHHGFAGDPVRKFLPEPGQLYNVMRTRVLPNTLVHVLGPTRDPEIIREMDPPSGESYLQLVGDAAVADSLPEPFSIDWVADYPAIRLDAESEVAIESIGNEMEPTLAAQLDQAVNGTSLMLVFQVGEAYLLFPGDAQWGTWKAALNNPSAQRLFKKTNFYKVGHHGSHNATPISFVTEHLGPNKRRNLSAMVSVRPYAKWPDIPREPLLEELRLRTDRLARSDKLELPEGFERQGDFWVETLVTPGSD
jgi:beta-lactamase superfamily II metal-dependent hydrolase